MEIKRRKQHYVWAHHLKAWCTNNQLFCLRKGNIFKASVDKVANERDFYRLNDLTLEDISFLEHLPQYLEVPEERRHIFRAWTDLFKMIFDRRKGLAQKRLSEAQKRELELRINNTEEKFHGSIETSAVKFLAALRKEDLSFLAVEKDAADFFYFLTEQYMRTRKMYEATSDLKDQKYANALRRIWNIFPHILATNLAFSMYIGRKEWQTLILRASDESYFITGDQPLINTYAKGKEAVSEMELYYPITPKLAFLMTPRAEYRGSTTLNISTSNVSFYNQKIFEQSNDQVYSINKPPLDALNSK